MCCWQLAGSKITFCGLIYESVEQIFNVSSGPREWMSQTSRKAFQLPIWTCLTDMWHLITNCLTSSLQKDYLDSLNWPQLAWWVCFCDSLWAQTFIAGEKQATFLRQRRRENQLLLMKILSDKQKRFFQRWTDGVEIQWSVVFTWFHLDSCISNFLPCISR